MIKKRTSRYTQSVAVLTLYSLFFGLIPVSAQDRAPSAQHVSVKFLPLKNKRPVKVPDFRILVFQTDRNGEKTEQDKAHIYGSKDLPLRIVILKDSSGSVKHKLMYEKNAVERFLHEVVKKDDLAVFIEFGSTVNFESKACTNLWERWITYRDDGFFKACSGLWTSDTKRLAAAVERVKSRGATDLYGALHAARESFRLLDKLDARSATPTVRVILLLTDGEHNTSESSKARRMMGEADLRASNAVLYFLYVGDKFGQKANPVAPDDKIKIGEWSENITEENGGKRYTSLKDKDMPKIFKQIADELRNINIVVYYSSDMPGPGESREIEICVAQIDKQGAIKRNRKGRAKCSGEYDVIHPNRIYGR